MTRSPSAIVHSGPASASGRAVLGRKPSAPARNASSASLRSSVPDSARIRVFGWRALMCRMAATPPSGGIDRSMIATSASAAGYQVGGLLDICRLAADGEQVAPFAGEQQGQALCEQLVVVHDHHDIRRAGHCRDASPNPMVSRVRPLDQLSTTVDFDGEDYGLARIVVAVRVAVVISIGVLLAIGPHWLASARRGHRRRSGRRDALRGRADGLSAAGGPAHPVLVAGHRVRLGVHAGAHRAERRGLQPGGRGVGAGGHRLGGAAVVQAKPCWSRSFWAPPTFPSR